MCNSEYPLQLSQRSLGRNRSSYLTENLVRRSGSGPIRLQRGRERIVRKLKEIAIPMSRRDTDVDALKAEIDGTVYDLFELTEEERQVIEDLLEVF